MVLHQIRSSIIKVGFANSLNVDCTGKSGGLLLMWDDELDIDLQSYSRHHIDVYIYIYIYIYIYYSSNWN